MKIRVVAMLIATSMITAALTGCGANNTAQANEQSEVATANITSADGASNDTASAEDGGEKIASTLGGKPWVNSMIKENITEGMSTSPKDDFYLYSNYDELSKLEIPEGEASAGTIFDVVKIVSEKKLNVIKDEAGTSHDQKLVNGLYNQITDWNSRNAEGIAPAQKTVEEIANIKDMDELNAFISDFDKNIFVTRIIKPQTAKDFDSDNNVLKFNQPAFILGGAEEYSNRSEYGEIVYNAYKTLNEKALVRMGYTKEAADKMFDDAISFEAKIAEKSFTSDDKLQSDYYKKTNNHYSKEEAYELFKNYPIEDVVKNSGYDKAKDVMVKNPDALKRVDEVYTAENLEDIKALLIVNYVNKVSQYLDKESYDAANEANNMVNGSQGALPDDDMAVKLISEELSEPLQRAYLQKYDATETKKEINALCKDIIAGYEEMLKGEDWLSEDTREKAIEKLENIQIKAAYPDKWYSDCKDLELSDTSLLESLENIEKYMAHIDAAEVAGKADREKWDRGWGCLLTDMYYRPDENSVTVPLGFLDGDIYYDGMPKEELYGILGCVIGHEISHAFDPNGAQFDKNGNMNDWWTEADFEAFGQRVKKVDDYYDTISVWDGLKVKGSNIDTEAIADMGGMKVMLSLAKNDKDFDYKKFFEYSTKFYLAITAPEYIQSMVARNEHPLFYLRTNVTVQQFDEFYETYDVKEGDNMYLAPEDRILVW